MTAGNVELRPEERSAAGWSDHNTTRARARRDWAEAAPVERVAAVLLGVIALAIRLAHLRQTMRHDEAYTYLHYATAPLATALSDYTYPNNHLFHTLLVWMSTHLFGNSEVAIRLPAFVFGMLVVPATYRLALRFADRGASLIAMALAAVWPALVLYSTNARGYSLITFVFIVMLLVGDQMARQTLGRLDGCPDQAEPAQGAFQPIPGHRRTAEDLGQRPEGDGELAEKRGACTSSVRPER